MELYDQITVIKEARKRRARALRLADRGKTLQEIADALGLRSRQRASQLVQKARAERAAAAAARSSDA